MSDLTALPLVLSPVAIAVPAACMAATAATLAYFGRRSLDKHRRERARAWICQNAVDAVNHAESLAELAMLVPLQGGQPNLNSEILEHALWLAEVSFELSRRADGYGLRKASRDLGDALRRLEVELVRNHTLFVPDGSKDDDGKTFAVRRLRERSDEMLLSARFVDIVAHLDRP
jgi:hypothetical protein